MNHLDVWISLGFTLVFVVLLCRWILQRLKVRRAAAWPVEVAHMQSSGVALSSGGGQPGAAAYYAELRYSYTVQGTSHEGSVRRRFMRKESAEAWIQKFTTADVLTVRYNPGNPADSVLLEGDQVDTVRATGQGIHAGSLQKNPMPENRHADSEG